MPNLTQKELLFLQDQLNLERSLRTYLDYAAEQCTDTAARNLLHRIASDHQRSYQEIARYLDPGKVQ
jgi:hypothetical protein